MPPAIALELVGDTPPEPVLITLTGLPVDGSVSVTVIRECPGEPSAVVHGFDEVVPAAATSLHPDVTAPMGRPLIYVLAVTTLATGARVEYPAGPVTVTDAGRHVLSAPWSAAAARVDLLRTDDARTEPARFVTMLPAGRRGPVNLVDVRGGDAGVLEFYTASAAETQAVRDLLADGAVVVSRHPADGCDVPASELLFLGDLTRRRRRTTGGSRVWSAPLVVSDDPDPARQVILVTQADVAAYYTGRTQADAAAEFPTQMDSARFTYGVL